MYYHIIIHVRCVMFITNYFDVATNYPFCVGIRGSVTPLFPSLGVALPISSSS